MIKHVAQVDPDCTEYPQEGVFREIVALARIVTSAEFSEEAQDQTKTEGLSRGRVLTIWFEDLDGKTIITHRPVEERIKQENIDILSGRNASFDQLGKYLANLQKTI